MASGLELVFGEVLGNRDGDGVLYHPKLVALLRPGRGSKLPGGCWWHPRFPWLPVT